MLLDALRLANPGLPLFDIHDRAFTRYGTTLPGDWAPLVAALERWAPIPDEGVSYVASCVPMEEDPAGRSLLSAAYGGIPAQLGYCSGRNSGMNGMEYHRASELLVAADDLVLLLGLRADLIPGPEGVAYESGRAEAFLVARGEAIELYSGTLHLAPCRARAGSGFRAAIVLPRGTNEDFSSVRPRPAGADALLRKGNKWIIAHPERRVLVDQGVLPAIRGPNVQVVPVDAVP